ncbi:hypothetical protein KSP40_PGU007116 [Platanthera guangdongensis]|uniref:Uncharacterized protein n=1 Tax=Platanthera guangdongensis TaxID=2320717 RepID=A0ABR2M499_9ASPA
MGFLPSLILLVSDFDLVCLIFSDPNSDGEKLGEECSKEGIICSVVPDFRELIVKLFKNRRPQGYEPWKFPWAILKKCTWKVSKLDDALREIQHDCDDVIHGMESCLEYIGVLNDVRNLQQLVSVADAYCAGRPYTQPLANSMNFISWLAQGEFCWRFCWRSFNVKSNWRHDRDCGNQVALQAGPDFEINSVGLVALDNQNISHSLCKLEEEIDGKHASPVEDCDKGKHDLTQTHVCESLQGKQQFKDAKFMVAISPKRTNLEGDGDLVRYLFAKIPEVCEEDKCESDCVRSSVEVGTHNILPYLIVTGSGFTNYDFDPFTKVKKVDEMLHDESRSITTIDSCNNYSGECQTAYNRMGGRIWKNN